MTIGIQCTTFGCNEDVTFTDIPSDGYTTNPKATCDGCGAIYKMNIRKVLRGDP